MFIFGHVGIGRTIVGQRGRALPVVALIAGMLLPDVIDKSLYYARFSDFISCTRTFGHTGLLLALVFVTAWLTRSRTGFALGVGMATHLLLDGFLDLFSRERSSALVAFAWPFLDTHFFSYSFTSPLEQLRHLWRLPIIAGEAVGLLLLLREYSKRRLARAERETAGTRAGTPSPRLP